MFNTDPYELKIVAAIEHYEDELKKISTGRAHASMLDGVTVEVYGTVMPLNQVANVSAPEAQLLQVTPFDPNNIQLIAAAIRKDQTSGFNPSDDGRVIRVPVPPLTEDRRRVLAKAAGEKAEDTRIVLRTVRQDALKAAKQMKDKKEMSEDDLKVVEKEIDRLMADSQEKIVQLSEAKEKDIMTI